MKKALAWLLAAASIISLAACGGSGSGGGSNGSGPANVEYGRYVEENITPEGLSGYVMNITTTEEGLIDVVMSDGKYNEEDDTYESWYLRYRSEDFGASWQQIDMGWADEYNFPYTDEMPESFQGLGNMTALEDGSLLVDLTTYNQNYAQTATELMLVGLDGAKTTIELAEIEGLKQQGNAIMYSTIQALPGNCVLFSLAAQPMSEDGGFGYSSDDLKHYVYDMNTRQLSYQINVSAWNAFYAGDYLYALEERTSELVAFDINTGAKADIPLPDAENIRGLNNFYGSGGLAADGEGGIYSITSQGVSLAKPGEESPTMVMKAENYSFGSPLIRTESFVGMGDGSFLMGTTKRYEDFGLYLYRWDPEAPATSDTVLRIYSLYESGTVRQAISEFKKQHPEITVEYTAPFTVDPWEGAMPAGESSYTTTDDALRALSTELLSGNGPDILIMDDLPLYSYIEQGILDDISDIVAQTDVAPSIINPIKEENNGLYYLPGRVKLPMIVGEKGAVQNYADIASLVEAIAANPDAMSFAELDWDTATEEEINAYYDKLYNGVIPVEERPAMAFSAIEQVADTLYHATAPSVFTDADGINKEGLTRLLEDTKTISDTLSLTATGETSFVSSSSSDGVLTWSTSRLLDYYTQQNALAGYDILESFQTIQDITSNAYFSRYTWTWDEETGESEQIENEGYVQADPEVAILAGYDGGVYYPAVMAGIVSNSTEKDAAKEFLLCLMSEGVQNEDLADGIAASEAGLKSLYETYQNSFDGWYEDIEPIDIDVDALFASCTIPAHNNETLLAYVREAAVAYCTGESTLDQAVDNVMSQSEIYFAERQ